MTALDLALAPLDVARRKTLLLATKSELLTSILACRRARVAAMATVQVAFLFVLSVLAPVGMFFVGPLTFGVPHLAADARYLILRQRLPRAFVVLSATSAVVIVAVRSLELLGLVHAAADVLEAAAGGLWILSALAFAARDRRTGLRSLALLPPIVGVFIVALLHPRTANIAMMHVHNVIGVATWLLLYPRKKVWELLPIVALVAGLAIIASGTAAVWTMHAGGNVAFGARMSLVGQYLAPGFAPRTAASIAIAFVFLQAVHYAIWIAWIPQEDLIGEGTLTFRMTARGLRRDFGLAGCGLIVAAMLGLAVLAVVRIGAALNWYLTLSRFHGLLELAVITFLLVRGEDLSSGRRRTAAALPA
jgi:hypothetical protein